MRRRIPESLIFRGHNGDRRARIQLQQLVPRNVAAEFDPIRNAQPCGKLGTLVLSGSFTGDATRPVDILLAGEDLSENRLELALKSLELAFGRELRYAAFTTPELRYRLTIQDRLVRDTLDFPHLVLLDRAKIL